MEKTLKPYDLVIVGAGPAGLSSAVNAESEGIDALVLDGADQLGGQAGTSTLIENYAGFPEGVTGEELTSRMVAQAVKFETEFIAPLKVETVEQTDEGLVVSDGDTESFLGKTVLISSGVQYRRLVVPNLSAYLNRGARYGSPDMGAAYHGRKVYVVGGANSAGQAAMHLSKFTDCQVNLLVRSESIHSGMSEYLSERILRAGNIAVNTQTEVVGVSGDGFLREITLRRSNGDEERVPADDLFILIGATPKTGWLPEGVERDNFGFVKAGGDLSDEARANFVEQTGRQPYAHETSMPGLFVAGDVRSGSVKRVASAVGDGAVVVPELHRYFAEK